MRCTIILCLTLYGGAYVGAAAHAPSGTVDEHELDEGMRVRITTVEDDEITGRVEKLSMDTLLIELEGGSRSMAVPFAELTRIEMSRGRRSRGRAAWSKAKWGALIAAVPGAILLGFGHEQIGEGGSSVGEAAALGAWSGALFGGLFGAAIGAANPGEDWEDLTPTLPVARAERRRSGFALAFTIAF